MIEWQIFDVMMKLREQGQHQGPADVYLLMCILQEAREADHLRVRSVPTSEPLYNLFQRYDLIPSLYHLWGDEDERPARSA